MNITLFSIRSWLPVVLTGFLLTSPSVARAHCDTLDGPVIKDARAALDSGDVTSVLKWVRLEDEREVREAFEKTMAVRKLNSAVRDLADRYFFETLVRVHRLGEGALYTGLKPAGSVDQAVVLADQALETESSEKLVKTLTEAVENGIRDRYVEAAERKKHSASSVEAGRKFVEAYVVYVHFVEGLHRQMKDAGHHHNADNGAGHEGH